MEPYQPQPGPGERPYGLVGTKITFRASPTEPPQRDLTYRPIRPAFLESPVRPRVVTSVEELASQFAQTYGQKVSLTSVAPPATSEHDVQRNQAVNPEFATALAKLQDGKPSSAIHVLQQIQRGMMADTEVGRAALLAAIADFAAQGARAVETEGDLSRGALRREMADMAALLRNVLAGQTAEIQAAVAQLVPQATAVSDPGEEMVVPTTSAAPGTLPRLDAQGRLTYNGMVAKNPLAALPDGPLLGSILGGTGGKVNLYAYFPDGTIVNKDGNRVKTKNAIAYLTSNPAYQLVVNLPNVATGIRIAKVE